MTVTLKSDLYVGPVNIFTYFLTLQIYYEQNRQVPYQDITRASREVNSYDVR